MTSSPTPDTTGTTDLGWVRDHLRCPVTGTELRDGVAPDGGFELVNTSADQPLAYPVRDGVPVLLPSAARQLA